jgi:formylglycine-generating enzyme required for sulfatase activity
MAKPTITVACATALAAAAMAIGLMISTATLAAGSRGVTVRLKASEATNAADAGEVRLYESSHALVIGIDAYRDRAWPRLSRAVSDARAVAAALKERGFDVTLHTNLTGDALEKAFEDFFIDKGRNRDARLFVWFAGHGHTVDAEGYLIPADGADPRRDEADFLRTALSLRRFGDYVRLAKSKHVLAVFDSCFAGTIFQVARSRTPPAITRVTTEPVRQFLSSGDAGQQVSDDGAFASLFVDALKNQSRADANGDGYLTGSELGSYLTYEVSNVTNNVQTPRHGKLRSSRYNKGDFVFVLPGSTVAYGSGDGSGGGADATVWATLQNSTNPVDFRTFLTTFPNSSFAPFARARIQAVGGTQTASLPPAQAAETDEPTRSEIREAQRLLTALGFDTRGVDGIAGSRTLEAVQRFRTDFRVPGSGIDHNLLKGLRNVFRAHQTATVRNEALALKDAKPTPPAPQVAVARPSPVPVRPATRPPSLKPGSTFRDCDGALVASSGPGLPFGASFCGPQMVVVPAGSFDMGDLNRGGDPDENPVHSVTIPRPFAVGVYEVTQAEWRSVMGSNPSRFKGDRNPVEKVSWKDAKDFLRRLSAKTGKEYRLLSEAEFEYVARAGSRTKYPWGNGIGSNRANCDGCGSSWDNSKTAPVGSFKANAFGLYDTAGNLWEWTEDCWNAYYSGAPSNGAAWTAGECRNRVLRGGSWFNNPGDLRSAVRYRSPTTKRYSLNGFRVARTVSR